MGNLIKINSVTFYPHLSEIDTLACLNMLTSANIKFNWGHFSDSEKESILMGLSSLVFGADYTERQFTKLPIIVWREYSDDYERFMECAAGSEELLNSNLIKYATLVQS